MKLRMIPLLLASVSMLAMSHVGAAGKELKSVGLTVGDMANPFFVAMGKGMASGLPVGAFMSSNEIMGSLKQNPQLGHITTFGGNPVIAAASLELLNVIDDEKLMEDIDRKEQLFREHLQHPKILKIHGKGLMLAPEVKYVDYALRVAAECMNRGLILFWLMYSIETLRITPPINISDEDIIKGCTILKNVLDDLD